MGFEQNHDTSSHALLYNLFIPVLSGGFKQILFSSRSLEKSQLDCIIFSKWGWFNHQLVWFNHQLATHTSPPWKPSGTSGSDAQLAKVSSDVSWTSIFRWGENPCFVSISLVSLEPPSGKKSNQKDSIATNWEEISRWIPRRFCPVLVQKSKVFPRFLKRHPGNREKLRVVM